MGSTRTEALAPVEFTLPRQAKTPSSTIAHGTVFISGGYLCYVSGATIIQIGSGSDAFLSFASILA